MTVHPIPLADINTPEFAERVTTLRKQRGMTQARVPPHRTARHGHAQLQPLATRWPPPSLEMLVKTADILAVSLDEWVGRPAKISEPSIRNAELQQRVHEVDQRPDREQQAVIRLHGCRWYETMDGRR